MIPTVAVVMAAYNAADYLAESIGSILSQTFTDFQLFIVDDGSTDCSDAVIGSFSDTRIVYLRQPVNQGKPAALNRALANIRSPLVAMMDADDIANADRLEIQVAFMQSHPEVGVSAGRMRRFGNATGITGVLTSHADIHAALLFNNPVANPTVMIRRHLLAELTPPFRDFFPLEDYDLWLRLQHRTCFANLPQVLIHYRQQYQNASQRMKLRVADLKTRIFRQALTDFGIVFDDFELALHTGPGTRRMPATPTVIRAYDRWLKRIVAHNHLIGRYRPESLEKAVRRRWKKLFYRLPVRHLPALITYWQRSDKVRPEQIRWLLANWM